jgi:hypothetical protein
LSGSGKGKREKAKNQYRSLLQGVPAAVDFDRKNGAGNRSFSGSVIFAFFL